MFATLLVVGLAVAQPSMSDYWFNDDVYVMRPYSAAELASAWHGPSDPTRFGTPGYRPLQPLWYAASYRVFGDSPAAMRISTVVIAALALTLLAATGWLFGLPLWLTGLAALLELTSKNFTYTYSFTTDSFHALQLATFAACLLLLAAGAGRERTRAPLLAASAGAWLITILIKDSGVALLPIVVCLAVVRAGWSLPVRLYALLVSVLAGLDFLVREIAVPGASVTPSVHFYFAQLKRTIWLAGTGSWWIAYAALAASLAGLVLAVWAAGSRRSLRSDEHRYCRVSIFAMLATALAALPGLVYSRSDLVDLPLYFFSLFVVSAIALAAALVGRHRRWLIGAVAAAGAASVGASIRDAVSLQHAMSERSVQTLVGYYDDVYGHRLPMPASRRARLERDLRAVGIDGPVRVDVFRLLYCRKLRDPALPATLPSELAWGDDFVSTPVCA
jgi:hypothetical protein